VEEGLEISPGQFKDWIENEITEAIVGEIVMLRDHLQRYLAEGNTAGKDHEFTTDRIYGRIEGLTEVFNIFTAAKEDAKERVSNYDH